MMEKRYKALRIIGTVYKVLGGISAVVTVMLVIAFCATSVLGGAALDRFGREFGGHSPMGGFLGGMLGGVVGTVMVILYGGGLSVTLYGIGEGVDLLMALEENTRLTAELLRKQFSNSSGERGETIV
jgi:hypothetical protein